MFNRPSKKKRMRRNYNKDFSKRFRISTAKTRSRKTNRRKIFNNNVIMNNLSSKINSSSFVSPKTLSNIVLDNSGNLQKGIRKRNTKNSRVFIRGNQLQNPKIPVSVSKNLRISRPLSDARVIPIVKTSPTGNVLERHQISYKMKSGVNVKKRTKL